MHVLIIPSWYPANPGDVNGSFFREQAIALRKIGCKVGVIYPQYRSLKKWKSIAKGSYSIESCDDCGVTTYRNHNMNWFPRLPDLYRRAWTKDCMLLAQKYINEQGMPDVIHAHSILNAGFVAARLKNQYQIPFVITEHSSSYARNQIGAKTIDSVINIASEAEKIIAVSTEFCNLLNKKIAIKKKWQYIPNIVSDLFLKKKLCKEKNEQFEFINVAFATENKAQNIILCAFASKFRKTKNVSLIIGGDGPELPSLRKLASTLGISDQTQFPGRLERDQVLTAMNRANAFVLSSRYETFGVVIIEALALGLPVIATRCGGPESIVREQDGILVPVNDVEALAEAMVKIYENQNQYNPVEIRDACRERFSEKTIARQLMEIYTDIRPHRDSV